jgi:hypothetical protein
MPWVTNSAAAQTANYLSQRVYISVYKPAAVEEVHQRILPHYQNLLNDKFLAWLVIRVPTPR